MTIWFITRHGGARDWAVRQGLAIDRLVEHLDPEKVQTGDTVIGSLPVNLAARVCAQGARYLHLAMELPPRLRGRELTADDMDACGARLEEYHITRMEKT